MKVKELKENISDLPDEMDVFIRANPCGNIIEARRINLIAFSDYGKLIKCIIIEPNEEKNHEY